MEHETLEQMARTERAGMPVWWAEVPGPFVAALCFRVGRADEELTTSGITHLVEHLALFELGRREHAYNGFVDDTRCVFYAEGEREEVLEFLQLVARSLGSLPLDRLELERRVLRAEARGRNADVVSRLLECRYGAGGYGLYNDLELGLRWLKGADVQDWCERHFTRGNGALWMTGEPPEDLDLGLRDGPRIAVPAPRPRPVNLPAFLASGTDGVALAGTGERTSALTVACSVAAERLYDRVRRELGLAYAPYGDYRPLDGEIAHVTIGADCQNEHAETVLAELWRTARDVAENGATEEELERRVRAAAKRVGEPDARRGLLDASADSELQGLPPKTEAGLQAELEALEPGDVARAFAAVVESALVLGPTGSGAPDPELPEMQQDVPDPVDDGERFQRPAVRQGLRKRRAADALCVGERGMTWIDEDGEAVTIEWENLAAAERRPDGQVRLFSCDGAWLHVSPHQWEDGSRALALIRERIGPRRMLPPTDYALAEEIERAVYRRIDDTSPVVLPLRALPDELSDDEGVIDLAVTTSGRKAGLLTVTRRRVLWLSSLDEERHEAPLGQVSAGAKGDQLELRWEDGGLNLQVFPKGAAATLASAIREHAYDE